MENLDTISREIPITVVDDLSAARRVMVRTLTTLGFKNLTESDSCAKALAQLKTTPCALVITDLHLKDGLGTDLLTAVREAPELKDKNIPFIIVTSDMDKEAFQQAVDKGVSSYLLKPFSPKTLAEKLAVTLK